MDLVAPLLQFTGQQCLSTRRLRLPQFAIVSISSSPEPIKFADDPDNPYAILAGDSGTGGWDQSSPSPS
jgi:hypothetical protein